MAYGWLMVCEYGSIFDWFRALEERSGPITDDVFILFGTTERRLRNQLEMELSSSD